MKTSAARSVRPVPKPLPAADYCPSYSEVGFTDFDLTNLTSLAMGGPDDGYKFNLSAVRDFLISKGHSRKDAALVAPSVMALLLLIRERVQARGA
jgi:hypothetical protein